MPAKPQAMYSAPQGPNIACRVVQHAGTSSKLLGLHFVGVSGRPLLTKNAMTLKVVLFYSCRTSLLCIDWLSLSSGKSGRN